MNIPVADIMLISGIALPTIVFAVRSLSRPSSDGSIPSEDTVENTSPTDKNKPNKLDTKSFQAGIHTGMDIAESIIEMGQTPIRNNNYIGYIDRSGNKPLFVPVYQVRGTKIHQLAVIVPDEDINAVITDAEGNDLDFAPDYFFENNG